MAVFHDGLLQTGSEFRHCALTENFDLDARPLRQAIAAIEALPIEG